MKAIEPHKYSPPFAAKLTALIEECGLEPETVADAIHISYAHMRQLLNPETKETVKVDLKSIADLFCISEEELRGSGSTHSKRIPGTHQPIYLKKYSVPLLQWGFNLEECLQLNEGSKEEFPQVTTTLKISEKAFALISEGDDISPRFPTGTVLIFDPMVTPKNHDLILTTHSLTKQLIIKRFNVNEMDSEILDEREKMEMKSEHYRTIATFIQAKHSISGFE